MEKYITTFFRTSSLISLIILGFGSFTVKCPSWISYRENSVSGVSNVCGFNAASLEIPDANQENTAARSIILITPTIFHFLFCTLQYNKIVSNNNTTIPAIFIKIGAPSFTKGTPPFKYNDKPVPKKAVITIAM